MSKISQFCFSSSRVKVGIYLVLFNSHDSFLGQMRRKKLVTRQKQCSFHYVPFCVLLPGPFVLRFFLLTLCIPLTSTFHCCRGQLLNSRGSYLVTPALYRNCQKSLPLGTILTSPWQEPFHLLLITKIQLDPNTSWTANRYNLFLKHPQQCYFCSHLRYQYIYSIKQIITINHVVKTFQFFLIVPVLLKNII